MVKEDKSVSQMLTQRISESSQEEDSESRVSSRSRSHLSQRRVQETTQQEHRPQETSQNKKVVKKERAKTPAEIKKQIEDNMSKFMKTPSRSSVSQGGRKRIKTTILTNPMEMTNSGSKTTKSQKMVPKLSGEINFTENMGLIS